MNKYGPYTIIHHMKINNLSHGASINYGPTIHKRHQANQKIDADEIIIGDEFNFGCPKDDEEED